MVLFNWTGGSLMKRQSNIFFSTALIATFAVMSACAPTDKGSMFSDRGSGVGADPKEKATGIITDRSEANQQFSKTILKITAKVADPGQSLDGKAEIEALAQKITDGQDVQLDAQAAPEDSALNSAAAVTKKAGDEDDSKSGLAPSIVTKERSPYLILVSVTVDGLGTMRFAGKSTAFGNGQNSLIRLSYLDKDCAKRFADMTVRGTCIDANCSSVIVQVQKMSSALKNHIEEVMAREGNPVAQEDYQLLNYKPADRTLSFPVDKDVKSKTNTSADSQADNQTEETQEDFKEALKTYADKKAVCIDKKDSNSTDKKKTATDNNSAGVAATDAILDGKI